MLRQAREQARPPHRTAIGHLPSWVGATLVFCAATLADQAVAAPVPEGDEGRRVRQAACACSPDEFGGIATGVLWRGVEPIGLADIAAITAPVLWFSADEPLLGRGHPPIPSAHPCDSPASSPVVYYQVTRIVYRGSQRVTRPEEDDPAFFDKVERFTLTFFFYYPEDAGRSAHVHDLEGTELEIVLDTDGLCRRVRVARVEALAHGNRWYSNVLEVTPDTRFPITVLVEQGKHATAPDRDADGRFVRGYDVTERVNDAWGVRNWGGADDFRLLPPDEPRLCVPAQRSSIGGRPSRSHYSLRPANRVRVCDVPMNGRFLADTMAYHGFGEAQVPDQAPTGSLRSVAQRVGGPDQWLSVNFRRVGSHSGAAFVLRGIDLQAGWFVPRFTVDAEHGSAQVMFTRSAARPLDAYVSAGGMRQSKDWKAVVEAGIKLRAEIPRTLRPFVLGCNFGGVRAGLEGVGFPAVERWQFVWEIGAGAW